MSVNNNFYATINELFGRALGTVTNVVDYTSFVDEGKKLADMEIGQLVNTYLNPLMNKVQKTLANNPSYVGALTDMYTGKLDYGVLETITATFYDMSQSTFDGNTLVDGTVYTDQFKYVHPDIKVTYHMNSDSWERDISIRDTDLRGAFTSPQAMDKLIQTIFISVGNSAEHAKEVSRLGLVADAIRLANGATAEEADDTAASRHYRLRSIYNATHDTELDSAEAAMGSDDFVKWAILTINDISKLMEKPNTAFNPEGLKTFTPASMQRLKINSIFSKSIKRAVIGAFNPANMIFNVGTPEELVYWQNGADRLRVTTNLSGSTTYSDHVAAVLYDERALLEMIQLEDTTSDRNNKRRYTTYHYQFNRMYAMNKYANFVIFTLD